MRGGALFFYEDRPDGGKGCTAVRADDADAFYVDGGGPLGAPWEEVRRAIEGLGGDWVAWEEGIASFPLGMIVTAPSSPLRTSAFAYRAPELEAPGDAGAVPGAGDGPRRGAIRRRGDRPRLAGDRVRGAVRCLEARAARDRSPPMRRGPPSNSRGARLPRGGRGAGRRRHGPIRCQWRWQLPFAGALRVRRPGREAGRTPFATRWPGPPRLTFCTRSSRYVFRAFRHGRPRWGYLTAFKPPRSSEMR